MRSLKDQVDRIARLQWTLGVALAVGVAAFWWVSYRPRAQRMESLRVRIEAGQREVSRNHDRGRTLHALAAEVQQLEERLSGCGRQMPKQPELGEFLGDVTRASQRLALREWKYEPGVPRRAQDYFELPIGMHFEGDFANAAAFLKQVEELRRLTRVKRLTMRSRDRKRNTVEVDVTMNIYFSEGL